MRLGSLAAKGAILGAFLCIVAVFLPAARLELGGRVVSQTTSRSFFELGRSQDAVQKFLKHYRESTAKRVGSKVIDKLAPRLKGRAQSGAHDVQDAIATLDSLRDEDIRTVGTIAAATLWSLLGLNLLLIALVFGVTVRSARLRVAAVAVVAIVIAALGVSIYLVLDRVVLEANRELGRDLLSLRGGAYLIPIAAVTVAASVLVLVIDYVRLRLRGVAA